MSEFYDARIVKCSTCGTKYASCEGPLCDCNQENHCEYCGERMVGIWAGDEGYHECSCCGYFKP